MHDKHQKTFGLSPPDPVAAKKGKGRDGEGERGREGKEEDDRKVGGERRIGER